MLRSGTFNITGLQNAHEKFIWYENWDANNQYARKLFFKAEYFKPMKKCLY